MFKPGRGFAAWPGATPRQNASGGKTLRRLFAHQGHLMRFAQELGSITKQGNRSIRRPLVLGAAIAGQAIAEGRPHWLACGGQAERRPARLAGRSSGAQASETGHRRFGQQARTDHMGRHDGRRGVSHAGLRTRLGKRSRWRNFSESSVWRGRNRRDERHGRDRRRGIPRILSRASELASLIGTFAAGLHQGQRKYPHQ
ncbi:MAG: hypothetical protein ACREDM_17415 [Methylocella sp.]